MAFDPLDRWKGIPQEQINAYEKAEDFAFAVAGTGPSDNDYWKSRIAERVALRGSNAGQAMEPHSCEHCQKLVIDPGQPMDPWYAMNKHSAMKKVVFDCTISDIHDGYLGGCPLMIQIWNETNIPTEEEQLEDTYRLVADLAMRRSMTSGEFTNFSRLRLSSLERPWKPPRKEPHHGDGTHRLEETYFRVYAEAGDNGAQIIRNRPMSVDPADNKFMQDFRTRLEQSINLQHELQYEMVHSADLPTRLLRIAKVDEGWFLHLEDVQDHSIQYCTISYCWGSEPSGLTNKTNVSQRYIGLDFDDLPRTIQDAVVVVNKLGFEYLWVDAICIVQESDDKAQEITKMAGIYGNSILTICASRALTAEEGFLQPRIQYDPHTRPYKLPFVLPGNQGLGSVILYVPTSSHTENRLQGRAWAFQERLMAKRILDFNDEATSARWWELESEFTMRDGGPCDHARSWSSTDMIRARDFYLQYDYSSTDDIDDADFMSDWLGRVKQYTALDMTLPTDRILAIASVAEKAARLTNGTYLAGLWLKHLPWSLMWSMSDRPKRPLRPSKYQGPSWSWTGVHGQVHSYYPILLREEEANVECEIIACVIDPVYATAPYGSLKSATLVIQAKARRARWIRSDKVKGGGDFDYLAYHLEDRPRWSSAKPHTASGNDIPSDRPTTPESPIYTPSDLIPGKIRPDALETEFAKPRSEGGQAFLDVILLEMFRHDGEVLGLVVREPEGGVCSRLGIFTSRKGQNYLYATDDRDHEILKDEANENTEIEGPDDEDANADEVHELMTRVKCLGSAWEAQINDEKRRQDQKQREVSDWIHFLAWFDDPDCQAQIFVIV